MIDVETAGTLANSSVPGARARGTGTRHETVSSCGGRGDLSQTLGLHLGQEIWISDR